MVKSKILSKYPNLLHFFGDKNSTFPLENIITAEQIHGNKVAIIKDNKVGFIKGYDGMVTDKPLLLGIRTADCLPIFFFDPKIKVIAAVHAGWKGLYKRIIKNGINAMKKLGCHPVDIKVAVGPHIQVCCYSVSKERMQKFENLFSEQRLKSWYLNLSKVALYQLESLGVVAFNIEISDICTSCNDQFWSFRRDGKKAGRMINVIGRLY